MGFEVSKPAAGGSGFNPNEHVGTLIVFVGTSLEADINTAYGRTNAARVQITVPLDGDRAGEVFYDSLIFGKVIVPSLTNSDGDIVVGRIVMGTAKAGQNAPYTLDDPTDKEVEAVVAWLEANIKETSQGRYVVVAGEAPTDDAA